MGKPEAVALTECLHLSMPTINRTDDKSTREGIPSYEAQEHIHAGTVRADVYAHISNRRRLIARIGSPVGRIHHRRRRLLLRAWLLTAEKSSKANIFGHFS
jgi:hypothetical protein